MQKKKVLTMDFETITRDTISIYQQNCGHKLTDDFAKDIIRALLSTRDTEKILQISPRHLLQVVFENKEFYGKSVYPCDIIQLRRILETKKITSLSNVLLFSNSSSDRIFKDQKCRLFLSLDPGKLAEKNGCEVKIYGGLAIFDSNELDITDAVSCIVVEGGGYENVRVVETISKETNIGCPVYTTSFIPGIDKYKFARTMHSFEVNIPSLGIHYEKCRSISPTQALQDILSIKWDRHPDSKIYKRRPERYSAEYWANSGFFDSIVRRIGRKKVVAATMPQINLTPQEQTIFNTLMDINSKMSLGITFRVAGGWVRDKLLGVPSDDIDIALDKMTGQQFVAKAEQYHKLVPDAPINMDSAYVIKQNADKSKHLETTALDIGGLKIDFVNLRDESYGDSRIPTMTLSDDPKVDAQRRDLTINSMFYNINTAQIEDYVGGLNDLQSMVLRTPLDPKKTFMDDPLRMLRVFRFYSRYPNANIDEKALNAMKDPEVHNAYRNKVAPERAGPEILKMFGAERPAAAIRAMFSTGLDAAIFDAEETRNLLPLNMDQRNKHHKFNLMEHTLRVVENLDKLMKQKNINKKDRVNMLMAAVFHDYGKAHPEIGKPKEQDPNEYTYVGHEDKSADIADAIMKRIGIGEDDRKFVNTVVRQHMRPHTESWNNKSIGKFIRDTQIPGNDRNDIWEFVMMHAQADTMAKSEEGDQSDFDLKGQHVEQMREYLNRPVPIQMKPLVDGNRLQQMFPNLTPKPPKGLPSFIKYIQDKLLEEQLGGNIADEQQALAFVDSMRMEIENMYGQKKAQGWYNVVKKADASSASEFGTSGRLPGEGAASEWEGVKSMVYRSPGSSSMVAIGDRFRDKSSGIAFEPGQENIYKVVSKAEGFIVLEDSQGKKKRVEVGVELPGMYVKV
jgi:tRNA nucleotidyltransferase/poly(A) polymerase